MYRNVMVPVDGSSFSREAVLHGLRIASRSGATLRLVRVATVPVFLGGPDAVSIESESLKQLQSAELADLYAIAAECRAHSTVNVTASLEYGPVVDALIGYARRHNVDLIVMRSHARRGLARMWFGSVADGLIRESGIPVLVVRPPSVGTALEKGYGLRRILVPLDGSALAEQSLASAVALARIEGASLMLLLVVAPWLHRPRGELESSIGPASARDVAAAQEYLDAQLTSPPDRTVAITRRVLVSSDVAETILSVTEAEEMDLVAIATRGRGSLARATSGSVSDRIMTESAVSTLVVHPAPKARESTVDSSKWVPATF
ncbi:MAG: universal stress protein [Gemmatimonadaceae bacterium]|nr:universal stress protein [Gemmatimonadaceae bacterium]